MADNSGTVLITGGAGYVGSHVAKALRAAGYETVIFDNLFAGHPEAALGSRLIVGDITDVDSVRKAIRESGAVAVMHFAAWLSVSDSIKDPLGYYHNNVIGTLTTLEAMATEGCRCFIFASTCAVYGEPHELPLSEDHVTEPISPYGQTKLTIEQVLPNFEHSYGIRSISLRYFNAAGADPEGKLGEDHFPEIHLIPRALAAAIGKIPIEIFGEDYPTPDGTCLRDYVHVSDLASAHILALKHLISGGASNIFNVGTERPYSVKEVLAVVESVTGYRVACHSAPRRAGDPAVLYASAERIRAVLGWKPSYPDLARIINDAWQWHQKHPDGFANDNHAE